MQKIILLLLILIFLSVSKPVIANNFGFGIQIGDPTAISGKYRLGGVNSVQFSLGSGSFAGLRITADYLWEFDVFNHRQFKLYAGPGAVIGFGRGNKILVKQDDEKWFYRENGTGLAGRGIVGINYVLSKNPIEVYLETGVLIGLAPSIGALTESSLGIRFYL